jgi:hypothetical protein
MLRLASRQSAPPLKKQKGRIQSQRNRGHKDFLREREPRWPRFDHREIRQHETQHAKRNDHAKISVGALQVVILLAITPAAQQQRKTYHTVEHDHGHRKQRIACQGGVVRTVQHDCGDTDDFDRSNAKREDQRAIGLAKSFGDVIGMPHHGKCGTKYYGK